MQAECVRLLDSTTGSRAHILVGRGFNCCRAEFHLDDTPNDPIWVPEGFASGSHPDYAGGIPVLFPFAGRIAGGEFSFRNQTYGLARDDGLGNALHGFVCHRSWRLVDRGESYAVGGFCASKDAPELLRQWPSDFQIKVRCDLLENRLRFEVRVRNTDPSSLLPCSLGFHPYFRVPLGNGSPDSCIVTVPAGSIWELDDRMLPTGRELPVMERTDLTGGMPFRDTDLDHVFGSLKFEDGWCRVEIMDPLARKRIWMRFDEHFQCCVVYNPPGRRAISIEPYTCVPDPFSVRQRGVENGLKVLRPGECFQATVEIGMDRTG